MKVKANWVNKYRKKPVVIEAIQYDGKNAAYIAGKLEKGFTAYSNHLSIPTLEGNMKASIGDWIIKGIQGEIYPCKPDIFEATYELASKPTFTKEFLLNLIEQAKEKDLPLTWLKGKIEKL